MKRIIVLIVIIHYYLSSFSSEYVTNGNFESNSGIPNYHSQLINLNDWASSTCEGSPYQIPGSTVILTPFNHSPDYFWTNGGYDFYHKPAHSGQGIVGMWEHEMIRQELNNPLSMHTQYVFSMYVRSGSINTLSESSLQIFLSEDEPKYVDENLPGYDCPHGCAIQYMATEAQKLTIIYSINLSDAIFTNLGNGWIHVTFAFTPTAIGNSGSANAIYNWLGIQTILNNPTAHLDPYGGCTENYIIIDDVSVTDMCDNFCLNTLSAFSYYIFQSGAQVFDDYVDFIGLDPGGQRYAFHTFIQDATYVYLEFFDGFGHSMYQYEAFDPNGLKDPDPNGGYYPDFLLYWDGARTVGNNACETYGDEYNGILIIKNCNRTVNINPVATIQIAPPSGCHPKTSLYNSGVTDCCVNHIDIDNKIFSTDDRVDVDNYINIALNGPVTIQGCHVKFHAGNQINIGPNLNFSINGTAEYLIVPCGTERKRSLSKRPVTSYIEEEENQHFQIYPVPATSYCDIKSEKKISDIKLFNNLSVNIIHRTNLNNNYTSLNLENVSNGVYFLVLEYVDHSVDYAKLVINK